MSGSGVCPQYGGYVEWCPSAAGLSGNATPLTRAPEHSKYARLRPGSQLCPRERNNGTLGCSLQRHVLVLTCVQEDPSQPLVNFSALHYIILFSREEITSGQGGANRTGRWAKWGWVPSARLRWHPDFLPVQKHPEIPLLAQSHYNSPHQSTGIHSSP